jgi:hypothetical protein
MDESELTVRPEPACPYGNGWCQGLDGDPRHRCYGCRLDRAEQTAEGGQS